MGGGNEDTLKITGWDAETELKRQGSAWREAENTVQSQEQLKPPMGKAP